MKGKTLKITFSVQQAIYIKNTYNTNLPLHIAKCYLLCLPRKASPILVFKAKIASSGAKKSIDKALNKDLWPHLSERDCLRRSINLSVKGVSSRHQKCQNINQALKAMSLDIEFERHFERRKKGWGTHMSMTCRGKWASIQCQNLIYDTSHHNT